MTAGGCTCWKKGKPLTVPWRLNKHHLRRQQSSMPQEKIHHWQTQSPQFKCNFVFWINYLWPRNMNHSTTYMATKYKVPNNVIWRRHLNYSTLLLAWKIDCHSRLRFGWVSRDNYFEYTSLVHELCDKDKKDELLMSPRYMSLSCGQEMCIPTIPWQESCVFLHVLKHPQF